MHTIIFTDMVSENWELVVPNQDTIHRIGDVINLEKEGVGVVHTVIYHYGKKQSGPRDSNNTLLHIEVVLNWR